MKTIIIIFLFLLTQLKFCQPEYQIVDNYEIGNNKIEVLFIDPLKELNIWNNNFKINSFEKFSSLIYKHLLNNPIYIFKLYNQKENNYRYYILRGNPKSLNSQSIYQLDIIYSTKILNIDFMKRKSYSNLINLTIDKITLSGFIFENMIFFQQPENRNYIGKAVKIRNFYYIINSFDYIKQTINKFISYDLENRIPTEIISKPVDFKPLFDYQKYGLVKVINREFRITINNFDNLGNLSSGDTRTEFDRDILEASTSNDITGVTSFPYFSKSDTLTFLKNENGKKYYSIRSTQSFINYYLKDLIIIFDSTGNNIEKIEGKLIIHGNSINEGPYTFDELYEAEFAKVGDYYLPKIIRFYPLDQHNFKKARYTNEIEYQLK